MNWVDNERYWIERHEVLQGSLASVGKIGTPESENRQRYARKKRRVCDILRHVGTLDLEGYSVLDAGCGIGMISELFFSLGADVSGVDASDLAISEARDRAAPPPQNQDNFKIGSLIDFHFAKQFDLTFCLDVMYHIVDDSNWEAAVANLVRHTKATGFLILIDQIRSEPDRPDSHVRFRTKAMYDKVLHSMGLRDRASSEQQEFMAYSATPYRKGTNNNPLSS